MSEENSEARLAQIEEFNSRLEIYAYHFKRDPSSTATRIAREDVWGNLHEPVVA